ncbi:MAG: hypothetical protein USCAAHI_00630 [Beijerinckiaceae bacterium]|nr:MAG: hypothetical protein USCAAHI_00630 [Beijerinckiaceae bacterium]
MRSPMRGRGLEQLDLRVPVLGLGIEHDCVRKGFRDRFADCAMMGEDDDLLIARLEKFRDPRNRGFGVA